MMVLWLSDTESDQRADGEPESDGKKNVTDAGHGGGSLDVAKMGGVNANGAQELRERVDVDSIAVGSVGACVDGVDLPL